MKSFTRILSSSKKSLIFKWNSYPEKIVDRCIKTFLNKLPVPKVVELVAFKKELILVLPYLRQQSFEIWNRIQCCLKKNTPVLNLKVVFQPRKQLSMLFKDKINKMLHSNLVYKFKCNICNDIYYGKTKYHFKVRACEHFTFHISHNQEKGKKPIRKWIKVINSVT